MTRTWEYAVMATRVFWCSLDSSLKRGSSISTTWSSIGRSCNGHTYRSQQNGHHQQSYNPIRQTWSTWSALSVPWICLRTCRSCSLPLRSSRGRSWWRCVERCSQEKCRIRPLAATENNVNKIVVFVNKSCVGITFCFVVQRIAFRK